MPELSEFSGTREEFLKARVPDIYYGKLYIEYYNFYQQYEDYFATILPLAITESLLLLASQKTRP